MRHRKFTFKIGKTGAHRKALLGNAVCSLFQAGRIKTTIVKAKQIRRLAEKMITLGKKGTLHARRQAIAKMRQKDVVAILFSEIAPKYEDRQGGYTRIMRLGQRKGDAAEMCLLELVDFIDSPVVETAVEAEEVVEATAEEVVEETAETEEVEAVEEAEEAEEPAEEEKEEEKED